MRCTTPSKVRWRKQQLQGTDLQNQSFDRDARRLAGQAIKNGKETMTAIIKANIQKVIGSHSGTAGGHGEFHQDIRRRRPRRKTGEGRCDDQREYH